MNMSAVDQFQAVADKMLDDSLEAVKTECSDDPALLMIQIKKTLMEASKSYLEAVLAAALVRLIKMG